MCSERPGKREGGRGTVDSADRDDSHRATGAAGDDAGTAACGRGPGRGRAPGAGARSGRRRRGAGRHDGAAARASHRPAVYRLQGPLRDSARPAARARAAHARGAGVLGRGGRPRLRRGEPHVLPRQERRAGPGRAARAPRGGCAAAAGARDVRPGDHRGVAAARGGHVRDRVQTGRAGMAGAVVSPRGHARRRVRAGARRAAWPTWAGRAARVRPARQARRRPMGVEGARRHAPRRLHAGLRGSESGPRPVAARRRRLRHAPQRRALQPGRSSTPGARRAGAALSQRAAATRGGGGAPAHARLRGRPRRAQVPPRRRAAVRDAGREPSGTGAALVWGARREPGGEADGAPRSRLGGVRRQAGRARSAPGARRAAGGNGRDPHRPAARHRGALRGAARVGGANRSHARADGGVGAQRGPLGRADHREEAGGEPEASRGRDPDPSDRPRACDRVPAGPPAGARAHAPLVFDPLRAGAGGRARAGGGAVGGRFLECCHGASGGRPPQEEPRLLTAPRSAAGGGGGGGRHAALVAAGILLTRVLGYVRQRAIAYYIGNGWAADALSVAQRVSNIIRNLLSEGTLSASFIPVYAALNARKDKSAARALAGAILGFLLFVTGVCAIIGIAFAPALTTLVGAGLTGQSRALAVSLMRLLFPMSGLMVISAWCLGVLNTHGRFFLPYAAPAVWNLAGIAALVAAGTWAG